MSNDVANAAEDVAEEASRPSGCPVLFDVLSVAEMTLQRPVEGPGTIADDPASVACGVSRIA